MVLVLPMKTLALTIVASAFLFMAQLSPAQSGAASAASQQARTKKTAFIGFVDANGDGINDRFADADGDGKNDITGKPYAHHFKFEDQNKDRVNDLWVDQDGDGVNDLMSLLDRKRRKQREHNIVDADGDGRNDITGFAYDAKKRKWHGERFGYWDEQKGIVRGKLLDENANGLDDRFEDFRNKWMGGTHSRGAQDFFIDEDGDGVCDGRGDVIRMMGRMRKQHRGKGKSGGHHR